MKYSIRTDGAERIAVIDGDLGLVNYRDFMGLMTELFSVKTTAYAVDLAGVSSIDSSGLGNLLAARKRADELGATFSLCNVGGFVKQTLHHADFAKMFIIK